MLPKNIKKRVKSDLDLKNLTKLTPQKVFNSASGVLKRFSDSFQSSEGDKYSYDDPKPPSKGKGLEYFKRSSMTSSIPTPGKSNTPPLQKISIPTNTVPTHDKKTISDLSLKSSSAPTEKTDLGNRPRRPAFSFGDQNDAQRALENIHSQPLFVPPTNTKTTTNPLKPPITIVETQIETQPESTTTPPDSKPKP